MAKKKKVVKKASPKKLVKKAVAKTAAKTKSVVKKVIAKKSSAKPVQPSPAKKINLDNFLTPLDDRILVQISKVERKTAGGLFIPDTVADVSGNLEGYIVASGKGHRDSKGRLRPLDVKVGDCVIFSQYSGDKLDLQGENVVLLREIDIMGVVNK